MALDWQILALLILAALLAGWVDAVVGGGGLIQLPALLLGLPAEVPVPTVAGINKVSSVAGTGTATLTYLRSVRVPWAVVLPLIIGAGAGASIGARFVRLLSRDTFTPIVLVALIGVGLYTARRPSLGVHPVEQRDQGWRRTALLLGFGLVIGFYDGMIGPGTGTFLVIGFVGIFGYDFLRASALAKIGNLTTNVAAIAVFGFSGNIWWAVAIPMAMANLVGGLLGAKTAIRFGSGFVRKVFLIVVSVLAARLAVETIQLLRR